VPIVVVDDGSRRAAAATSVLQRVGFQVTALPLGALQGPSASDVIVIGPGDADHDSATVCARLRDRAYVGAIIALGVDRARGIALLEAGADDFVLAPPSPTELVARVRAALRRSHLRWRSRSGDVEIDLAHRLAYVRGRSLGLTAREYGLLVALVEASGGVLSRAELHRRVWGRNSDPKSNLVQAHLSRLRDKLEGDARLIENIRGSGYRLVQ